LKSVNLFFIFVDTIGLEIQKSLSNKKVEIHFGHHAVDFSNGVRVPTVEAGASVDLVVSDGDHHRVATFLVVLHNHRSGEIPHAGEAAC